MGFPDLAIISGIIVALFTVYKYFDEKRLEFRRKRFEQMAGFVFKVIEDINRQADYFDQAASLAVKLKNKEIDNEQFMKLAPERDFTEFKTAQFQLRVFCIRHEIEHERFFGVVGKRLLLRPPSIYGDNSEESKERYIQAILSIEHEIAKEAADILEKIEGRLGVSVNRSRFFHWFIGNE